MQKKYQIHIKNNNYKLHINKLSESIPKRSNDIQEK